MSGNILRASLIVLLSLFVARFLWLTAAVHEGGKAVGNAQVNMALNDIKMMRQALDFLWDSYNLGEGAGKTYTTNDYEGFKYRIEQIAERRGGMPFVLPTGKNFTDFSYMGHDKGFHVKVRAKDKDGTAVHGTVGRVWHE